MLDLRPLYDVQERLEHAAVAGTGILNEDFRLKRAQEGLAPLAAASPVFAKIHAGLETLLTVPPEKRGGALLDVLALVDAVVYTQASVGMSGELEPLPPGAGKYQEVSYGQLQPLLEALTGTGGGRYHVVKEMVSLHPEYFADYRVIPALVAGLGDSYGELADLNVQILARQGPELLPLLEAGFDPAGGRAMARRVEVMARAAGARANEFFLAQLPQAKKEVRLALVDALGCDESNASLLLDLCRTERKGAARDLAHRALARLNTPEGESYLMEQAGQDPDKMLEILQGVSSGTASRLTAQILEDILDQMEAALKAVLPQEIWTRLKRLCAVLEGKRGAEICALYRRVAGLTAKQLDRQVEGEKGKPVLLRFSCFDTECQGSFRLLAALALCRTIMKCGDAALCRLAMEFQAQGETDFLAPALAARLIMQSPADSYDWAEKQLLRTGLLGTKVQQEAIRPFRYVLGTLHWDPKQAVCRWGGNWSVTEGLDGAAVAVAPLDVRWFSLLSRAGGGLDGVLLSLLDGWTVPNLPETVSRYLYQTALRSPDYSQVQCVIRVLVEQGWTQWDGFVVQWAQKNGQGTSYYWELLYLLDQIPVPPQKKTAQLQELERLIREKKLKIQRGYWPESEIQKYVNKWELEQLQRGENPHV